MGESMFVDIEVALLRHRSGVCDEDCPYCGDPDCPPLDAVDEVARHPSIISNGQDRHGDEVSST